MTAGILAAGKMAIGPVDLGVIVLYLVLIVGIGCWVGLRRRKGETGKNYFLAGGTLTWPMIGLALFSTNISTIHLVSQAQEGYMNGLAYGNFEWMAPFLLITLSLFFAPFYFRSKVATLPDFLEQRYSRGCRDWLAALSIVSAIVIHIGFTLYTGAVVLEEMFGIDKMTSIIGTAVLTGVYTVIGGLLAVVLTESLQTIILLAGAILITVVGLYHAGGWHGVAAHVEPVKLTVLRSANDPAGLPWYSVLLGYPIIGLWYWCADQTIVQRVLGAKDENHARVGPLFAGFIKILPVFIFVFPGTISLALLHQGKMKALPALPIDANEVAPMGLSPAEEKIYQAVKSYSDEEEVLRKEKAVRLEYVAQKTGLDQQEVSRTLTALQQRKVLKPKTDAVYAHMILELLPAGLRGVLAAALLAALMSTVSGALNSIATLFSYDLYRRWRPQTPDRTLVVIGRVATAVAMVLAILWSPLIGKFDSIYRGSNTVICYLAPPITTVFIWGVFWRRASSRAALTTLAVGSVLGLTVFLLDWYKEDTGWDLQFMMAAFLLFAICSGVLVVTSLIWPHQHTAQSERLVWKNPLEALTEAGWGGLLNYKLMAGLLFAIMILLYLIFATPATERFFGLIP